MLESNKLLKMFFMYLVYFLYSYLVGMFIGSTPIEIKTMISFVFDVAFLLFMIYLYKDKLKEDMVKLKNIGKKKVIVKLLLGIGSFILLNFCMGLLTSLFFEEGAIDGNTSSIQILAQSSIFYAVFKTMIFGIVAEELLFRETLNDCVKNDFLFIIISAIIYTLMNLIFATNQGDTIILATLLYLVPALLFSYIYVKNERNIVLVMLIKFVYNIIPLSMLIIKTLTGN